MSAVGAFPDGSPAPMLVAARLRHTLRTDQATAKECAEDLLHYRA